MSKCSKCGIEGMPGAKFCADCGNMFNQTVVDIDFNGFQPEPQKPQVPNLVDSFSAKPSELIASFAGNDLNNVISKETGIANSQSAEIEVKSEENHLSQAKVHAKLIIERGAAVGTEFYLTSNETQIGRWDADSGIFPDVDLDSFDPEAKVSRRHARIFHQTGNYVIEDIGSTNGTYINRGKRLLPGNRHLLSDGDEVIVGKTFLRFRVIK